MFSLFHFFYHQRLATKSCFWCNIFKNVWKNQCDILVVSSIRLGQPCNWDTSGNTSACCYFLFLGQSARSTNGSRPYLGSKCSSSGHGVLSQETAWSVASTRTATWGTADALVCGTGRFKRIKESRQRSQTFLEPRRNVIDFQIASLYKKGAHCCQVNIQTLCENQS